MFNSRTTTITLEALVSVRTEPFIMQDTKWCRGVVVKHADLQYRGFQFDSSMRYNEIAIGEEGNGRPPHQFHFPRKSSEPCLWFLLRWKSSMQCSFISELAGT